MPTFTIERPSEGRVLMQTSYPSALPDARTLAALYASGHILLEDGKKTTANRRKELMLLRENLQLAAKDPDQITDDDLWSA